MEAVILAPNFLEWILGETPYDLKELSFSMQFRIGYVIALLVLLGLVLAAIWYVQHLKSGPRPLERGAFEALYADPLSPPEGALRVFHLGHSLVGRDMPAMLAQLAGPEHGYDSQLGWGAFLREHWEPDVPVKGFETENAHPRYRDAHEAVGSGEYDAVVVTEALGIRDAIRYFTPHDYLRKWAVKAQAVNPKTRVYFYETWHKLTVEEGWLDRLDDDLGKYWEGEILRRALAYHDVTRPIYVIPAGQVMARFVREVEARGGVGPIRDRTSLFDDEIHFNDYGAYLVALTHYAVLYGRSPVGLPHALRGADGAPAADVGAEAARLMQETVWEVVTAYAPSGVKG